MKIIGHRGASGSAAENSLTAIRAARIIGVDAIEIDIRITKDNKLVVFHDKSLRRLAGRPEKISDLTQAELVEIKLKDGGSIPTIEEALEVAGDTPFIIEGKDNGWSKPLVKSLAKYKYLEGLTVLSFNQGELAEFGKLMPGVKLYLARYFNSLGAVNLAIKHGFSGVTILLWSLNPIVYRRAIKHKISMNVFTNSNIFIVPLYKLLLKLYPLISLTTNYPDKLISLNLEGNKRK